jgi:hypothetical protein
LDIPAGIKDTILELDVHQLYTLSMVARRVELSFTEAEKGECVWCLLRELSHKFPPEGVGICFYNGQPAEPGWYGCDWQSEIGIHTKVEAECRRIARKWFHIIQQISDEDEPWNEEIVNHCKNENLFNIQLQKHSCEKIKLENVDYEIVDLGDGIIKHDFIHYLIRTADSKEEDQIIKLLNKEKAFVSLKKMKSELNKGLLLACFEKDKAIIDEYVNLSNKLGRELERDLIFLENQVDFSRLDKPINHIQWKKYGPYSGTFCSHKGHVWKNVFRMFL